MLENIQILEEFGVIQITSAGLVTEEDLHKSRRSVSKICREQNLRDILVDARAITSLPSITPLFQHGVHLNEHDILRPARFAVVVSDTSRKEAHFIETVATNRGANLRNFECRDQALAWLKS